MVCQQMSLQSWCRGSESELNRSRRVLRSGLHRGRCWLVLDPDEGRWLCRRAAGDTPLVPEKAAP